MSKSNRRRFLLGAGAAGMLPFLPSIVGESRAADATPRRFIFLFTSNGQRPENWYPAEPASWKTLSSSAREAPLDQYAGGLSPIFGPEFDPLLSKMLLFRGLDFIPRKGGGHYAPAPLSGWQGVEGETPGPSIDQILADSAKVYPTPAPVKSVHMLVKQAFQSPTTCSMSTTLEPIAHQTSTAVNYDVLFGGFVEPDDELAKKKVALRVSLLDRLHADYELLSQSPRIGSEDRQRLEAHMALISDLESRLGAMGGSCTKPDPVSEVDLGIDDNLADATKIDIDLLVAGMMCGRTNVGTLMLCPGTDLRDFSYLGGPGGEHHSLSHDAAYDYDPGDNGPVERLAFANNWYAKQVAYLLTQLDSVVEDPTTGRTYLDNSIVYWGNEDGCNGYDAHVQSAMPVALWGSAGGQLKTGRYIDYRRQGQKIKYDAGGTPADVPTDFIGRPFNSLLISLLEAFGLTPDEWDQDGQGGIGDYGGNYLDQYSVAEGHQPLPFLT